MTGYTWHGRDPRQELQAKIWRWWPTRGPEATAAVDAILAAADTYLREMLSRISSQPPAEPPALTARRRQALGDALCTRKDRTS
jgi:hypothetical protein